MVRGFYVCLHSRVLETCAVCLSLIERVLRSLASVRCVCGKLAVVVSSATRTVTVTDSTRIPLKNVESPPLAPI